MANDFIKAAIKLGTAAVATGFAAKTAIEGKKNAEAWRTSFKQPKQVKIK